MATVMGEEMMMGDDMSGNNNNNMNMNMNTKRRRRKRSKINKTLLLNSALESFEKDLPSNLTLIHQYEKHVKDYFEMISTKKLNVIQVNPRQMDRQFAILNFFDEMKKSFENFKTYCAHNKNQDCAILDTNWKQIYEQIN